MYGDAKPSSSAADGSVHLLAGPGWRIPTPRSADSDPPPRPSAAKPDPGESPMIAASGGPAKSTAEAPGPLPSSCDATAAGEPDSGLPSGSANRDVPPPPLDGRVNSSASVTAPTITGTALRTMV